MTVRLPLSIAKAVDEQRQLGRSNSQIEKIVGLPSGTLSRPYLVDDSFEKAQAAAQAAVRTEVAAWNERNRRFWRALGKPKPVEGWRPANDCISDRPNAGRHFKPRSRA